MGCCQKKKKIMNNNEISEILYNDKLIPDLLDDLQLPTISAFVVKKDFWEKIEDSESDSF